MFIIGASIAFVKTLTPKSLKDELPVVVLFTDNTKQSEDQADQFQTIGDTYKTTALGTMNCVTYGEFCAQLQIKQRPLILMITDKQAYVYNGPIDATNIEQWAEKMLQALFIDVPTKKEFHDAMDYNKIECYFLVQGPDKDAIEMELSPYKGRNLPIAYFKSKTFSFTAYRGSETIEFNNKTSLIEFISQNRLPVFTKVTHVNFQDYISVPGKLCGIFATNFNDPEKKLISGYKKQVIQQYKEFDNILFGYMNHTQYIDFFKDFSNSTPFFLILNTKVQPFKFQIKPLQLNSTTTLTLQELADTSQGQWQQMASPEEQQAKQQEQTVTGTGRIQKINNYFKMAKYGGTTILIVFCIIKVTCCKKKKVEPVKQEETHGAVGEPAQDQAQEGEVKEGQEEVKKDDQEVKVDDQKATNEVKVEGQIEVKDIKVDVKPENEDKKDENKKENEKKEEEKAVEQNEVKIEVEGKQNVEEKK